MVADENSRVVEDKIVTLEKLFEEKKYAQLLRDTQKILSLSPGNRKIIRLEEKAKKAYREEIQELRDNFKKSQTERLTKILNEDPAKLPDELFLLESNNARDPEVFALTKLFRDKLIEKKINEKKDLIYSNKYDVIESFIDQLRKIDQKNPRIAQIVEIISRSRQEKQFDATREFIYKGQKYLDTMMKLAKYDKVMQAAQEILAIEKSNKFATKLYQKAKQLLFIQTRDTVIQSIKANLPNLKAEYLQNKNNFVKL